MTRGAGAEGAGAAPLRTCVVGVGSVGREHARILTSLPGSRLVGVCDREPGRGREVAARLGCRHEPVLERLLAEADAAVVAVPASAHAVVARTALEAGCHVLVEKPLAASLAEADDLVERAEVRGLELRVGHVERYNRVLQEAASLLDRPRFIEALRIAPFAGRGSDVSVVLDLMIHDLDLVLHLIGTPVERVSAVGVAVLSGSIDLASARLEFADGAVADLRASRVSARHERRLRIFQPSGYLSLDLASDEGSCVRRRNGREGGGSQEGASPRPDEALERVRLTGDDVEPLQLELADFLRAARGLEAGPAPAREARAALALALEITADIRRFARREGVDACR